MTDRAEIVRQRDDDKRRILAALYDLTGGRVNASYVPHDVVYAKAGLPADRGRHALDDLSRSGLVMMKPSHNVALLGAGADQVAREARAEAAPSGTLGAMPRGLAGNRLALLRALVKAAGGRTNVGLLCFDVGREIGLDSHESDLAEVWLRDHGYVEGMTSSRVGITVAATDTVEELDEQETEESTVPTDIARKTETRLFISHAAADLALAQAVVELIEAVLRVDPHRALRCTSVVGYTLDPGSSASKTLRENLRDCDVVLGLLTPKSLESKYVLMELGAAWAFEKIAVPLLAGTSFADLPGPFKDLHAVDAANLPGVLSVLEVIERHCGMPKRTDAARLNAKAAEFVARVQSLAKAPTQAPERQPADARATKATPVEEIPDETAAMLLVLWLEKQEGTGVAQGSPVDMVQVAKQAGVSVGAVDRLIHHPDVLGERWRVMKRGGGFLRLEQGPARVRDTDDGFG